MRHCAWLVREPVHKRCLHGICTELASARELAAPNSTFTTKNVHRMTLPFEFAQRPICIGNHTEQWRIRKSGLTFTCIRNTESMETGDAKLAIAFFTAGRDLPEVADAAHKLVGTVDAAQGNWPAET